MTGERLGLERYRVLDPPDAGDRSTTVSPVTGKPSTPATPKRRRFPAPVRRDKVLEAGLQVFSERGYRASMDEIAKATGVTRTVLYYYFPTKKDLFRAVLEAQVTEFLRHIAPAVATQGTPEDRLRAVLDALLGFAESEPRGWDLVFARSDENDPDAHEVRAVTRGMMRTAAEVLLSADVTRIGIDPQGTEGDLAFDVGMAAMVEGVAWWRRHPGMDRPTMLDALAGMAARVFVDVDAAGST